MTNTPSKTGILVIQTERPIQRNHSDGIVNEPPVLLVRKLDTGRFSIFTTDREFIRELKTRKDTLCISGSSDPEYLPMFVMHGGWNEVDRLVDRFFVGDQPAPDLQKRSTSGTSSGATSGGSQS